jgi:hypothetical protein
MHIIWQVVDFGVFVFPQLSLRFSSRKANTLQSIFSLLFILSFTLPPMQGLSRIEESRNIVVLTVQSGLTEMFQGYSVWGKKHPALDDSGTKVHMPSIDLYSPKGESIYHGVNSEKNAEFIRTFSPSEPQKNAGKMAEVRPTLSEALAIFPEFKPYITAILAKREYTFFAMTYPDEPLTKAQNEAIQQLKSSARKFGIRILEVQVLLKK